MIIEHYPIRYKEFRLAIMPRPRAGDWLEEEIESFSNLGYHTVVSLLTKEEENELNLSEERNTVIEQGLSFYSYPIVDRSIPRDKETFIELVQLLTNELLSGKGIGIHCRMGIGRAGFTCSAILMSMGLPVEDAMALVSSARRLQITDHHSQVEFLQDLKF